MDATPHKHTGHPHWLDRYASGFHAWTCSPPTNTSPSSNDGNPSSLHKTGTTFSRPLGLVESSFDADGEYYGGRADMTATLTLAFSASLSPGQIRSAVVRAWTALRLRHVLLLSRRFDDVERGLRCFAVDMPATVDEAVRSAEKGIVWVEESYSSVDAADFHDHALSVARIVDPDVCMSKLHVLPAVTLPNGTHQVSFLVVMAHQISDGLTANGWFKDWIHLLNQPAAVLEHDMAASLDPQLVNTRLPAAQEDLYPRIAGNAARQRWIWAILRVLRHVKRPSPPSFPNPLYRQEPLARPPSLDPKYAKLFDYTGAHMPPLASGHLSAVLSPRASARLLYLCRSAKLSIGAGCFALAALAMMEMQRARTRTMQSSDLSVETAMSASFPLNPRAFFADPAPLADSCMLAFSDGIVMPFLGPELPIEKRFLLTARTANRELKMYQKRMKGAGQGGQGSVSAGLDRHAPGRLLATGYLMQIERVESKMAGAKRGTYGGNPQGALQASSGGPGATCGVSSMGSLRDFLCAGEHDVLDARKGFVADYRSLRIGVRAREGEFLVGCSTDAEGRVGFGVSYDVNAIDPEAARLWGEVITGLLEGSESRL